MNTNALLIGLLIFVFLPGCEKDNNVTRITNYAENAKLKRILLYASIDSEEPIAIDSEYEYDSLGRVQKVTAPMHDDGKIVGTIRYDLYEYNSKGQLARISNYNANINSPTGFINLHNRVYFYSDEGLKIKELIEYPQIGSFEYTLFTYSGDKLIKAEKYDNMDKLERNNSYEYNVVGELIKEIAYAYDNAILSVTNTFYKNGVNTLTEVYWGNQEIKTREIRKTYDSSGNLIIKESDELSILSSAMSHVLRYEYFDD